VNITENYLKFKVKITIFWQHIGQAHRLLFQAKSLTKFIFQSVYIKAIS